MAGMFFTLQEVVEKLGKSEAQVQEFIKDGKLREFRDGAKLLFKVSEVEELAANVDELADAKEESFVELLPEEGAAVGDDGGAIDEEFLSSLTGVDMDAAEESLQIADTVVPAEESVGNAEAVSPPEDSLKLAETEMPAESVSLPEDSLKLGETKVGADESLQLAESEMPSEDTLGAAADLADGADDSFFASLGETLPGLGGVAEDEAGELEATSAQAGGVEVEAVEEQAVELGSAGDDDMLANLTSADTNAGTSGVNVLSESEGDFHVSEDSKGETQLVETGADSGLGDLDNDLNLDSVGSGSGLLDLSLQADDTSLGAVLDDILPSADEVEGGVGLVAEEGGITEEADKIFQEAAPEPAPMQPAGYAAPAMPQNFEVPPDSVSNACGVALLLPFAVTIVAAIIVINALRDVTSSLLELVEGYIMYGAIGLSVLVLVIIGVGAAMGGSSTSGKPKAKKAKKPKKPKKPKAKKAKKKK